MISLLINTTTITIETSSDFIVEDIVMDVLLDVDTDGNASVDEDMELFHVPDMGDTPSSPMTVISAGDETPILTEDLLFECDIELDTIDSIKLEDMLDPDDTSTNSTENVDVEAIDQPVISTPPTSPSQIPEYNRLENLPYEIVERSGYPL